MNEAENVRGFATAFYETMEAFDLPKYLMTHRDQWTSMVVMKKLKK